MALVLFGGLSLAITTTINLTILSVSKIVSESISELAVLLTPLIVAYAGYSAVKKYKVALGGSALSGIITGVIATAINGTMAMGVFLVSGAEAFFGREAIAVMKAEGIAVTNDMLLGMLIITIVITMVIAPISGAIFGTIGGFIAKKTAR